jgi:hypothetical protein
MTFESFSGSYFDKVAMGLINMAPGVYELSKLTKEPEKFKLHVKWYGMCAPEGFNKVEILDDKIEIKKWRKRKMKNHH